MTRHNRLTLTKINAAFRLKAKISAEHATSTSEVRNDLKNIMSLILGKGMKFKEGENEVTFFGTSSTHDIGVNDLRRLQTAMTNAKVLLTIHTVSGKPAFTFEINEE